MTAAEVPRPDLADALLARARHGGPLLVTGPHGAGKTTLLLELRDRLARDGWIAVYLDLMGAASSPEQLVSVALETLPASAFGRHLPKAAEIRRLAAAGRSHGVEAVQALFALWACLDESAGRPVALLFDEVTEIRSLAYFTGLRQVDRPFAAALAARPRGTVLASSYPTAARRLWTFEALELPPLTAASLTPLLASGRFGAEAAPLLAASFGWPRYVRILLEALSPGEELATAWAREMAAGRRLEVACRSTYESLLLRSRGYGMSKAVLAAVAEQEGLNLTALVARVGRTPGAVRDYLQWLVGVDALRMVGKRYFYVDGMVRQWVRLHGRGLAPSEADILAGARALLAGAVTEAPLAPTEAPAAVRSPTRHDSLMEID